jgi:hypothetical protein
MCKRKGCEKRREGRSEHTDSSNQQQTAAGEEVGGQRQERECECGRNSGEAGGEHCREHGCASDTIRDERGGDTGRGSGGQHRHSEAQQRARRERETGGGASDK